MTSPIRSLAENLYASHLVHRFSHLPNHIAIIQDGNRRYAKSHGISVDLGHRIGADTAIHVLEWVEKLGIKHVTLYAFSTENFNRSKEEVSGLHDLFIDKFTEMLTYPRVHKNKVNITVVGDRSLLDPELLSVIEKVEAATKDYDRFYLHFAIAYGGRNEIVETARDILAACEKGTLRPEDITPEMITGTMYPLNDMPPVDLILRTANDKRTSNFLPWLANGNEAAVCFSVPTWPEFRYVDFVRALRVYDQRLSD
ncbi:MAG TPA: polyprenyl diphosphate synthase [Methanocorpusculum sp.]|nr:polyprenyl diphosphate synthase [Methanocorpusculum sp.]